MQEPYGSVIESYVSEFAKLGLKIHSKDEFRIVFSDGSAEVTFGTERYYHPSLMINITDAAGNTRILEIVKRVLDPNLAQRDKEAFQHLNTIYDYKNTPVDLLTVNGGFRSYVEILVTQALHFLGEYRILAFHLPFDKALEYKKQTDAVMDSLGFAPKGDPTS